MDMLIGKSSELYQRIYTSNLLSSSLDLSYMYEKDYGHIIIECATINPDKFMQEFEKELANFEVKEDEFERIRKTLHGSFILEFNNISRMSTMFFADYIKGVNSLAYMKIAQSLDWAIFFVILIWLIAFCNFAP